jgi:pimeloyl-ACP methyl ester carboxylesterase
MEVEGVRLHVAELGLRRGSPGAEPAVVLIHGASGNMEDMRLALGEKLAATHRVILIDRPGHGWSSRPADDSYASPARQAGLVTEALKQLGVRRAILVGHSWGGAFARYALTPLTAQVWSRLSPARDASVAHTAPAGTATSWRCAASGRCSCARWSLR